MPVAPVRERGLKSQVYFLDTFFLSRSREGAWIEIDGVTVYIGSDVVAPVRERGLKLLTIAALIVLLRRSREGAWIEMRPIKILLCDEVVAPVRERGLKCTLWQVTLSRISSLP